MKCTTIIAAAILMATRGAGAADYYVAPSGHDSSPGTRQLPWQTIQHAANVLKPGDTAFVRGGTYSKVSINVSGSASGGWVKFLNFPGERPVIDAAGVAPAAGETALFLVRNRSYVVIQGFELRNYKTNNPSLTPAGILLTGACHHVQIRACDIHDMWNTGGDSSRSGNAFGIAVYGSSTTPTHDVVIDRNDVHHLRTGSSESVVLNGNVKKFHVTNNTIHDNNNIGIDFIGFEGTCPDPAQDQAREGVCRGNRVWNIGSEGNQAYPPGSYGAGGIYCDGATRVLIERNIVHDADIGVELASEHPGTVTSAVTMRDNFIYSNRQTGLYLGGYARSGTGGSVGCIITGNTFFKNDTLRWDIGEAQLRFRTSDCDLRGNIFYGRQGWLITSPVSPANNTNNRFDYNLYYSGVGRSAARWSWNGRVQTGFAAWRSSSGQDGAALFAPPRFKSMSTPPDLHLDVNSPAVNAGDPAVAPGRGERDIDGELRVSGNRVDMGADELTPAPPAEIPLRPPFGGGDEPLYHDGG